MELTIGTDIIEINRFREKPIEKNKKFYEICFTKNEIKYCLRFSDPYIHLAGIFAAKEAVLKCFNGSLNINDVEIQHKNKIPYVNVKSKSNHLVKITISHTNKLATATAIKSK